MKFLVLLFVSLGPLVTSVSGLSISVLRLKGHTGSNVYESIANNTNLGSDTIDYNTYYGTVDLDILNSYSPDIILISNPSGGNKFYTTSEGDAIQSYLNQTNRGRGILGEGYVFNSIGATRPKLHFLGSIFGFRDGITYSPVTLDPVFSLFSEYSSSMLFQNFGDTYTSSGFNRGNIPDDGDWGDDDLGDAVVVGETEQGDGVITYYDAENYRAIYIPVWAAYNGSLQDQQMIYNAFKSIYYGDPMLIPEPTTYALILGGTVLGYAFWRSRK